MSLAQPGGYGGGAATSSYASAAPAYATNQGYGAPIPLTPVIIPNEGSGLLAEEEGGGGGGGGGFVMKKIIAPLIALPLALLIPLAIIALVIAGRLLFVLVPIFFPKFARKVFVPTTTPYPYTAEEQQPYDYGNASYPSAGYGETPSPYGTKRRRQAESAMPSLTIAQVEKLTQVVLAAIKSQECVQRLLCEAGQLSRNVSDTAHSVAKSVEPFVPDSIKASYDIFTQAEKCEQYACGTLQVKK